MNGTPEMIERTMVLIAEARLHFDASVSGPVKYSPTLVSDETTEFFWATLAVNSAYLLTEKGKHSRYGEEPVFSPEWLAHLSVEDHKNIAVFIRKHKESFWAIYGLLTAISHECLSDNPRFAYTMRNFLLLWDSTNSIVLGVESEDCYSLHAISGIGGVDVSSLSAEEQERYRALAGFAVESYLANFFGRGHGPHPAGFPFAVDEIVYPGHYEVQEPYRSMVLEHPEQARAMIEYMKRGYEGNDLAALLKKNTPAVMATGVL
jgi:hypothetical protein